ncbi:Thioredoxin-like reductase [Candidatus Entotheonellaceae bacterium PAL068K]
MARPQDTVEFYWDMVCPWCWITSRWMEDVGRQKNIHINWKFFSLKKINEGRDMPERFRVSHAIGLRALRVAAAVRQDYGNDAVGKLYTVMGTRRHHDQQDISTPERLAELLQICGLPQTLAAAADDESWDQVIEADMEQAKAKAGDGVGVPLIVLDGGDGPGFFGPVFSPAPTGETAVQMWDAMVTVGRMPGFYEFKRTRETGPVFGERPSF